MSIAQNEHRALLCSALLGSALLASLSLAVVFPCVWLLLDPSAFLDE
jgi:hypothetical protein